MALDIDFIDDYIIKIINGLRPAEIKNLTFRDGGVEISPGNTVPCVIPEWLKDQEVEITINCNGPIHDATIKSNYGDYKATITASPDNDDTGIPHSHTIHIKCEDKLKDGDLVAVAKYTGVSKYIILAKVEKENA